MIDKTEKRRRVRQAVITAEPASRESLLARYGQVWDTLELAADFILIGFTAPLFVVRRKADGKTGTLAFQNLPRFYFNFQPHEETP